VKCPAWFDADFNTKRARRAGYCIITDIEATGLPHVAKRGDPGTGGRGPERSSTRGIGNTKGSAGTTLLSAKTQVNWQTDTSKPATRLESVVVLVHSGGSLSFRFPVGILFATRLTARWTRTVASASPAGKRPVS